MVPDSASTAFAMYSGVKTTGYTMGYDNTIGYMKLDTVENATRPSTILDWAQVKYISRLDNIYVDSIRIQTSLDNIQ